MRTLWLVPVVALAACSPAPAVTGDTAAPAATGLISETTASPQALDHFHKGETLFYNVRTAEAAAEFAEALRLDPNFVLARAYHAQAVLGDQAARETEETATAAARLPEAERLFVQSLAAATRGDAAEAEQMLQRLTTIAPRDWRAHYALGLHYFLLQRYHEAISPLTQATKMNAGAAIAQNMRGYALLQQDDAAGAIGAFEAYVRALPQEPNPQDSLGEALMAAGRFQDADAAFSRALALAPQFWNAHEGLAYARIYNGNWAAGRQALDEAQAKAPTAQAKMAVAGERAAAAAAQGRTAEALQFLDAAAQTPGAEPGALALLAVRRALVLSVAGQPRQALAAIAPALATAEVPSLPAALARPIRTQALRARVTAEGQLGDSNAATATAALLEQDASTRPGDPAARKAAVYARGVVALANRDFAAARTQFEQCADDDLCQWQAIAAADGARDRTAAAAARERLLRRYRRDPVYLLVRSRLAPATARAAG